jgi:predicted nuclease of predicted toxin-antitoxin system
MTARFLVDEDLPRSTARALRSAGYETEDLRDVGLRGHTDEQVFAYAQAHSLTLMSADMGFTNPWRFPSRAHAGIVLIRLPNELTTDAMNREILSALATLADESLTGLLIILELGRIRIRR